MNEKALLTYLLTYLQRFSSIKSPKLNHKKAFTLAEVLITLVVIGIVVTSSIPSLLANAQKAEYVTGVKKAMADFCSAISFIKIDNAGTLAGVFNNAVPSDIDNTMATFCTKLNCVKICPAASSLGNCWHANNKWYSLANLPLAWGDRSSAVLNNGQLVFIELRDTNCNNKLGHTFPVCGSISIDINGFKPPNTIGRDIFRFWFDKDKLIPHGVPGDTIPLVAFYCSTASRGDTCTQKVLQENAMNY